MVPGAAVLRMRNCTTDSYPLRQSGFALTVGQAVAEELNVSCQAILASELCFKFTTFFRSLE